MGWRDRWQVDNDGMPHRVKPIEVPMTTPLPKADVEVDADGISDIVESGSETNSAPAPSLPPKTRSLLYSPTAPKQISVSVNHSAILDIWKKATVDAGLATGGLALIYGLSKTFGIWETSMAATLFGPIEQYQNRLTNPDNVPDGM